METKFVKAIIDSIKDFRENPFLYFYESDIQSDIYSKLRKEYSDTTYEMQTREGYYNNSDLNKIKLGPVATEYHYLYEGSNEISEYSPTNRIDIAVLDSVNGVNIADINSHRGDNNHYDSDANWLQPVKYGIELKFSSGNYYPDISGMENDLTKLKSYFCSYNKSTQRLKGLALCFCHIDSEIKNSDYKIINEANENENLNKLRGFLNDETLNFASIIVMKENLYFKNCND